MGSPVNVMSITEQTLLCGGWLKYPPEGWVWLHRNMACVGKIYQTIWPGGENVWTELCSSLQSGLLHFRIVLMNRVLYVHRSDTHTHTHAGRQRCVYIATSCMFGLCRSLYDVTLRLFLYDISREKLNADGVKRQSKKWVLITREMT